MHTTKGRAGRVVTAIAFASLLTVGSMGGQTVITEPDNRYSPSQDVELGREAAQQVEEQLPILDDDEVSSYVSELGRDLVDQIPDEFRHPEFRYTFKVVNVREINAFALPGGPLYLNRGMIEAARTEGEVVSVIAHEMSHVALRHGTAQATKATKYEIGSLIGAIVGSVIGGRAGSVVAQGTQFGLGTAFLRFSREFEQQADLLGSHIMADAGYDPVEMANMFKLIEEKGGSGGPQWLSDHPNPGNRQAYITREAEQLNVRNPVRKTARFTEVKSRLNRMSPAPTTEDATRNASGRGTTGRSDARLDPDNVDPPSSRFTDYTEGDLFRVSVPSNWRELPDNTSVIFAPDGAFGTSEGRGVFTHGIEIGIDTRNDSRDVRTATDDFVDSLSRNNPDLSQPSNYTRTTIDTVRGLRTTLTNVSEATGNQERIALYTAILDDGSLFYAIGVAPRNDFSRYEDAFSRIVDSIQLLDYRN